MWKSVPHTPTAPTWSSTSRGPGCGRGMSRRANRSTSSRTSAFIVSMSHLFSEGGPERFPDFELGVNAAQLRFRMFGAGRHLHHLFKQPLARFVYRLFALHDGAGVEI